MRTLLNLLFGLLITLTVYSQQPEFKLYSNGLIYSEQTMSRLTRIADSLNLKFRTCDFNKTFNSKSQSVGHLVKLSKGDIRSAKKDIENQIPFEDFVKKYPKAEIEKDVLIIKNQYINYKNKEIVEFEHFDLDDDYGLSIEMENFLLYKKNLKGTWLIDYNEKTTYSQESLSAFYFPEDFTTPAIPKEYALMIGYSDCMVDTTTAKFHDNLKNGWITLPEGWTTLPGKNKENLLEQMRSTRVVGMCSQDSRPREHAINIALLSAETYNWKVFLKAHLDIMNDRFERVSDGSYAWGERNTYIRELEELNINVSDLILGISFRFEDPATNHYFGSIGRLGRALSETKDRTEIEQKILSIVSDTRLDYYNRLLFYFLFKNYNYYLKDEASKKENAAKLTSTAMTFPDFISKRLL